MLRKMFPNKLRLSIVAILVATILYSFSNGVDGANILGVFTSHSASHLIIHMSVMKALAERGHNVTVVTTVKPKVTHKAIKNILIPIKPEYEIAMEKELADMANQRNGLGAIIKKFTSKKITLIDLQFDALKEPEFTKLYNMPDTHFDVMFIGYFMNDFEIGLAAKFKCPLIIDWMGAPTELLDPLIGNPSEVSYVPNFFVSTNPGEVMDFKKRFKNLVVSWISRLFKGLIDLNMKNRYNELFQDDPNVPSFEEMKKNISLLFCNSHLSEGPIRPNVPAIVEIGGIQIKDKPDPLPEDIAKFLDSAKDGAILFSLGSNIRSADVKPEIIKSIFKVLSSLKQKVIWKWENLEKTPGNSPNILYKKWMPQDDILAHPNVKLFITHAGKGGIAESQYHGVPMVALPIFGDQQSNAHKMVSAGYGQQLDLLTLTTEAFKRAVVEILSNSSYAENVKKFSDLYRDRPMSAKDTAVYWTEYVIRHRGARHMQSPMVHLNYFQIQSYDVIAVLLVVFYLVYRIIKIICKMIWKMMCGGKAKVKTVTKTTNKKGKKNKEKSN